MGGLVKIAMALLLFPLLTTLSAVNSEHRKPFTAFHPAQRDYIQKQQRESFARSINPSNHAVDVGSRLQKLTNSQEDNVNGLVEAIAKPAHRNGPQENFDPIPRQQLLIQQKYTFHPAQIDPVQKPHYQGFNQSSHPLIQGLDVETRLQKNQKANEETANGLIEANLRPVRRIQEGFSQKEQPNFLQQSIFPFNSGTFIGQATSLVESAKTVFEALANDSQAIQNFDHIFETSDCLNNIQDAVELMEESKNLINENRAEIIILFALTHSLENEKNSTTIILASVKMFRIFDELLQNLSAKSSNLCISSPKDSVQAFKKLVHILANNKNNKNVSTDDISMQLLETSSTIVQKVGKFLNTFNNLLSSENICEIGKRQGDVVYAGIDEIMERLASLFDVLGFEEHSNGIRKQGDFVKAIVDAFSDNDEQKVTFKCMAMYGNLVLTLEHLTKIVQNGSIV